MEVEEAQKNLIWSVMPIVIGALIGGTLGHFYMRYKENTDQPEEWDDNFSDDLDEYAKKLVARNIIDEKTSKSLKSRSTSSFLLIEKRENLGNNGVGRSRKNLELERNAKWSVQLSRH